MLQEGLAADSEHPSGARDEDDCRNLLHQEEPFLPGRQVLRRRREDRCGNVVSTYAAQQEGSIVTHTIVTSPAQYRQGGVQTILILTMAR